MASRYFVETPVEGDSAVLTEGEAHHVARVMRAGVGDCLVLFDGSGWEYEAEIKRIGKHAVELAIVSRREMDRELPLSIHLGVALPKGDRQSWLVEKAVELGVARLTPLETERSVAQPSDKALARLRRGVIEASKQCGRNRLMQIEEPQRWSSFIVQRESAGALRWVAHPGGEAPSRGLASKQDRPHSAIVAIGPEGGFSPGEIQEALTADWFLTDLGPAILRVETAALAAVVLLSAGERQ